MGTDTTNSTSKTTFSDIAASMIEPMIEQKEETTAALPVTSDLAAVSPDQDTSDGVSVAQDASDQDGNTLDEGYDTTSLSPNTQDEYDEDDLEAGTESQAAEEEDVLSGLFDDTQEERASDDPSTDDIDTSKLGDDLMISVTVDGEDVKVPLGELKKRHAGEGAIEQRLQAATESRNTAAADYEKTRELTSAMLTQFGQALFRRTVPQPDNSLLNSNPTAYMQQKELYEQETSALTQSHNQLSSMMATLDQTSNTAKTERRKAAGIELRRIMPVFNDPVKGPKVRTALMSAATELGFTEAQVNEIEDPLMFKALALAARELARQKVSKTKKTVVNPRTTPSAGTANRKPATSAQRNQKQIFDKAAKSGKVDDIAASMIEQPTRKRGRR